MTWWFGFLIWIILIICLSTGIDGHLAQTLVVHPWVDEHGCGVQCKTLHFTVYNDLSAQIPIFKLIPNKEMSFPVYMVGRKGKKSKFHHTSSCHYSALAELNNFGNITVSPGSISLCDKYSIIGIVPINSSHFGYVYPQANSKVAVNKDSTFPLHFVNLYPVSLTKQDWYKLDSAYRHSNLKDADALLSSGLDKLVSSTFQQDLLLRKKRSIETLIMDSPAEGVVSERGPFLLELYLIADSELYAIKNSNRNSVVSTAKNIVSFVNNLYRIFNVHVAITGLEIWDEYPDGYNFSTLTSPGETVDSLRGYALKHLHNKKYDCVHLLHGRSTYYGGKSAGMAKASTICSSSDCVGFSVITPSSENSATTGIIMSHELAHNFGSGHDEEKAGCKCSATACIMSSNLWGSVLHQLPWSDCSRNAILQFLDSGFDHCLLEPKLSAGNSVKVEVPAAWGSQCGNGIVEAGESCDCGGQKGCSNTCCNPSTCQLTANATCASGACCDFNTCNFKIAGTICRKPRSQCDFPEYCNGKDTICPSDVYMLNGAKCGDASSYGFCHEGTCPTRDATCKAIWGNSYKSQAYDCYQHNIDLDYDKSKTFGCKFPRLASNSIMCKTPNDAWCGRLMCAPPKTVVFLSMSDPVLPGHYHKTTSLAGKLTCLALSYDYGPSVKDPALVQDGSFCGNQPDDDLMCREGSCISAAVVRAEVATADTCQNGGSLNSRGHCHCPAGFAPPDCSKPGYGGSVDSGPLAPEPGVYATSVAAIVIVVLILLIAVSVGAVLLLRYSSTLRAKLTGFQPCADIMRRLHDCSFKSVLRSRPYTPAQPSKPAVVVHAPDTRHPAAANGASTFRTPVIGEHRLVSCTYQEPLTDRTAVPPQVRPPRSRPVRPPPVPPPPYSHVLGPHNSRV